MPALLRWKFEDPSDVDFETRYYTMYRNPSRMTSPFPQRAVSHVGTTAIDGQTLMWEGTTPPKDWQFGGPVFNAEHYEALRSWVYDRQGRMWVYDHFGRRLTVVFTSFDADPPERPKIGRYWFHEYTVHAIVLGITQPVSGLPA